jgi:sugar lactone lactonase YvrE
MVGIPTIPLNARWAKDGITIAGGYGVGNELNQLFLPEDLIIDKDGTVFITDWCNNRIVEWKKNDKKGCVVIDGNENRNELERLFRPSGVVIDRESNSFLISDNGKRRVIRLSRENDITRVETILEDILCWGLTMDDEGSIYVTDIEKHEVRRYPRGEKMTTGTVVAGGNGQGKRNNQLNTPLYVFVDSENAVYVSDSENHRVMKWVQGAKEGICVAGGQDFGEDLTHLWSPSGIIVDKQGTMYIADSQNHRVVRWVKDKEAYEGELIAGGEGQGEKAYQFDEPKSLYIDKLGDLYVVDRNNHRVQRFSI